MPEVSMRNMLEAGVHFGHQTHRWNPKMKPFIYGPRNGIYIIDLEKTVKHAKEACVFIKNTVADGGKVLFVATKNQAASMTKDAATRANMPYVSERWLGGTLTNFATIRRGCEKLDEMDRFRADGTYELFKKKERVVFDRKQSKLDASLGGIRQMRQLPAALFVIDPMTEEIAVKEANRLGIPVVALVDTNCDPDRVDFVIPGNDDAIKSVSLFVNLIADSCLEGAAIYEQKARVAQGQVATEGQAQAEKPVEEKVAAGPVVEKVKRPKLLNIPTEIDYRDSSLIEEEEEAEKTEETEETEK
jgi:small subunit ribosomal protein S2